MDGMELPGFKKKSFSMYYGGGEIWFEHLDGMYGYTDLAIQKLASDYIQLKKPSMPSLIAVNLDETQVNEELCNEIARAFTVKEKRYTKIVFIGVKRQQKKLLQRLLSNNGFALAFINDFEKAKEWLISE
jgi:hypothetical protein